MKDTFDQYFFAPVAAVRPWLLEKCVLVLLALDLWTVRMDEAYRYYEGGLNMAHFAWLHWILPAPGAATYLGVIFATGILAMTIAIGNLGTGLKLLLTVLYSTTWAMSRLDSFQHHYLLSWVLLAIAFFPRVELSQICIINKENSSAGKAAPPAEAYAWAWVLLLSLVAVVYFYTSVAKLDSVWQSGACLAQLQGMRSLMESFGSTESSSSVEQSAFWAKLAHLTVVAELFVASGYLIAPGLDRRGKPWIRKLCWVCWLVAIALHVGFEVVGLRIGWFSYFMILLATISLLPAPLLQRVIQPLLVRIHDRQTALANMFAQWHRPRLAHGIAFTFTATALLGFGWWTDLPGFLPTAMILAAMLLIVGCYQSWNGPTWQNYQQVAGVVVGICILALTIGLGPTRSKFYPYRVSQLFRQCEYDSVESLLPKAEDYASAGDLHSQFYLAEVYATGPITSLRDPEKAIHYATAVCGLVDFNNASALQVLACAHAAQGNFAEAKRHVRRAQQLLDNYQSSPAYAKLLRLENQFATETPYFAECTYQYRRERED